MTYPRRVIREEALNKAVAVFKGQQNEKADQSKIVPDSAERQREMKSPGKYVVPQYGQTVQQDMEAPRPSTKYGHPVFGGGWEEFSEPDAYALHPAMLAVLGGLGDVFAAAYRNQPVNVKLNDQQASASKSMARSIQKQAQFQGKPVKKIAEGWIYQNNKTVPGNVAYATLSQLGLGTPQRPVDNHNYNFGAGAIKGPFGG